MNLSFVIFGAVLFTLANTSMALTGGISNLNLVAATDGYTVSAIGSMRVPIPDQVPYKNCFIGTPPHEEFGLVNAIEESIDGGLTFTAVSGCTTSCTFTNKPEGTYTYRAVGSVVVSVYDANAVDLCVDETKTAYSTHLSFVVTPGQGIPSGDYVGNFNSAHYDVYYGDINGDTVKDIYLHPKQVYVLLHGDIVTPIVLPKAKGLVIFSGQEQNVSWLELTQSQFSTYGLTKATQAQDYLFGDFNGDNVNDIFIRGANSSLTAVTVAGTGSTQWPYTLGSYPADGSASARINLSDRTHQLKVADFNGDGRDNLILVGSATVADEILVLDASGAFNRQFSDDGYSFQQATAVGSTAGRFRINESGAATYSIPLTLPAGTAGVAPELSLQYSSMAGNGLLGRGWSLGGLSSIARCRKTYGQDNQSNPITFTNEDQFCLDGQRLLLVEGTHASVGAVYKTEIDSDSRVQIATVSNGEPDTFIVTRKDGSKSTYGTTAQNAKRKVGLIGTVSWFLARFEDNVGNPIEYLFTNTGTEYYLNSVSYAYAAGVFNANVNFVYETRPDVISGYMHGELLTTQKRLSRIEINNTETIASQPVTTTLRSYRLGYRKLSLFRANTISQLVGVQECASNGSSSQCLPATSFEWSEAGPLKIKKFDTVNGGIYGSLGAWNSGDFNGDGKLDLAWEEIELNGQQYDSYIRYALSNGQALTRIDTYRVRIGKYKEGSKKPWHWSTIDYNGDGRTDIVAWDINQPIKIYLSEPNLTSGDWRLSSSNALTANNSVTVTTEDIQFVDVNGDGLLDMMMGSTYRLLEKDSTQTISSSLPYKFGAIHGLGWEFPELEPTQPGTQQNIDITPMAAGDFNGDGVMDSIVHVSVEEFISQPPVIEPVRVFSGTYAVIAEGNKRKKYAPLQGVNAVYPKQHHFQQAPDINGDGLADLVFANDIPDVDGFKMYRYSYQINNGNGFNAPVTLIDIREMYRPQLQDVNGDGWVDFVYYDLQKRGLSARLWQNSAYASTATSLTDVIDNGIGSILLDINADGLLDVLNVNHYRVDTVITAADNPVQAVISTFKNGMGNSTNITYESLALTDAYDRMTFGSTLSEQCVDLGEWGIQCASIVVPDSATFYSELATPFSLVNNTQSLGAYRPVMELMGSLYVATRVESSAPAAGATAKNVNFNATSAIRYRYGFGKVQASGRGLLGFEYLKTTDEQTGVETTTWYRQDYPFIGYPLKTEVRTAASVAGSQGNLLSSARNEWEILGYDPTWASNLANGITSTAGLGPLRTVLKSTTEKSYKTTTDLSKAEQFAVSTNVLSTVVTQTVYDDYDGNTSADPGNYFGNPTKITIITKEGNNTAVQVKQTSNTYGNSTSTLAMYTGATGARNVSYRELGRLTKTDVTTTRGADSQLRTSAFSYYTHGEPAGHAGLLKTETVEPGHTQAVTNTYEYDSFGNISKTSQSAAGENTRFSQTVFDATGRYANSTINTLGHNTQEILSRSVQGLPITVNGLNGLVTTFSYDELGREISRSDNIGSWAQSHYENCSSVSCPTGAVMTIRKTVSGGGWSAAYMDVLGRTIRSSSVNFSGEEVHVDSEYDNLSRVKRKSEPHSSIAQYWTEITYDALGRVISTTLPGISTAATIKYDGLITTTTNPALQTKTETHNVLGELIRVDNNILSTLSTLSHQEKATLSYEYDIQGNLRFVKTLDPQTPSTVLNTVQMCYNQFGQKVAMRDPDKGGFVAGASATCPTNTQITNPGWWVYNHNAFGELVKQIDAKGQTRDITYDALGRVKTRSDKRSDNTLEGNTTWVYDTQANGVGKLDNVSDSVTGYQRTQSYLAKGLPSTTVTLLPDNSSHMQSVTYDTLGRVDQIMDAASDFSLDKSVIKNEYNSHGFLSGVVDAYNINTRYYQIINMDERGNVTESQRGNGVTTINTYDPATGRLTHINSDTVLTNVQKLSYQWDDLGNLQWRKDNSGNKQLQENFTYDNLNRLTGTTVGTTTQSLTYDTMGNITHKSDVGNYTYTSQCATGYGTHAVCETSDGIVYSYDANGNLTGDTAVGDKGGRQIHYTTFDKPDQIIKGTHTTQFAYSPDRTRYKRVDIGANGTTTTVYIGSVEKLSKPDGTQEIKRQLPGGALVTLFLSTPSPVDGTRTLTSEKTRYLYKDHLGSLDVITDELGVYSLNDQYSFDAWGQRRQAINWSQYSIAQLLSFGSGLDLPEHSITERGFTSHEMLDAVGVIHMNGRIYDPRLGRFLQADPFVDGVTNTQGYNRYSYVHNNPLSATDPSGYFSFRQAVGIIVAAVGTYICGLQCGQLGYAIIGATAGAAHAAANGGNILQGAILGGISGAAFSGIAGADFSSFGAFADVAQFASFGAVGGITSVLSGGKFGHGFIAAGVGGSIGGKLGGVGGATTGGAVLRTVIRSVVGGTISKLTGGKFANGAAYAAFASLINEGSRRYLGKGSGQGGGVERTNEELQKAVEALRTNEDFAAIEKAIIKRHGSVKYEWTDGDSSSYKGVVSISKNYDSYSYDTNDINYPDDVWGKEAVAAFESTYDVSSQYPGMQRPFSLQRIIVHEAIHGTMRPLHGEMNVIEQTNDFMEEYFNEPRRANHALRPIN